MGTVLAGWWSAIWPNLAANVLWVPLAAAHHVLMRRHAARQLAEHAERQRQELADHLTTALAAAKEITS